ncbi:unnamed protein product [Heligmosomoides polygyrus]|uniref:G_PROTEIN_RECEP_F1_2 domain-containing protein n=1 Tax=Heligmosomoides polygyrus TaxID=6339 RepID=A0A183FB92_HELPZ|nr:unnamed protein product [Heligmosomoides polygyrus]
MDETTANGSLVSTTPESCYFEQPPMMNIRFWLVAVFGSTVSFISIINNVILFYVFISRFVKSHIYLIRKNLEIS